MANLNPLILFTEPVTRQELFDMWSDAAFSGVTVDDFAEGFMPIVVGSSFSDAPSVPQPGQLYWHQSENVMYCWHDEIEGTAVSLWLAIGPDKFEVAMLLQGAAACGEAVELVGPGRVCQAIVAAEESRTEFPVVCGFNQSHINAPTLLVGGNVPEALPGGYWMGETAVSGEWIRVGIDGLVYAGCCPGSHPSESLSAWTNLGPVILNSVPGLPSGVVSALDVTSPFGHIVGATTQWCTRPDGGTRTEPWWLTKIAFIPRASRASYYAS